MPVLQSGALEIFVEVLRSHEMDEPVDNTIMSSIGGMISLCQSETTLGLLFKIGERYPQLMSFPD